MNNNFIYTKSFTDKKINGAMVSEVYSTFKDFPKEGKRYFLGYVDLNNYFSVRVFSNDDKKRDFKSLENTLLGIEASEMILVEAEDLKRYAYKDIPMDFLEYHGQKVFLFRGSVGVDNSHILRPIFPKFHSIDTTKLDSDYNAQNLRMFLNDFSLIQHGVINSFLTEGVMEFVAFIVDAQGKVDSTYIGSNFINLSVEKSDGILIARYVSDYQNSNNSVIGGLKNRIIVTDAWSKTSELYETHLNPPKSYSELKTAERIRGCDISFLDYHPADFEVYQKENGWVKSEEEESNHEKEMGFRTPQEDDTEENLNETKMEFSKYNTKYSEKKKKVVHLTVG